MQQMQGTQDPVQPSRRVCRTGYMHLVENPYMDRTVRIEKLLAVCEAGLRRFFLQKMTILDFLDMPIFEKVHLCSYLINQETLRRLSKAICVSNVLKQLWKQLLMHRFNFQLRSGVA